jgi:hypothetical protein
MPVRILYKVICCGIHSGLTDSTASLLADSSRAALIVIAVVVPGLRRFLDDVGPCDRLVSANICSTTSTFSIIT